MSNCVVVDFAYLTGKHKLVKLTDLCNRTDIEGSVLDAAQEMMKQDKELDLVEAIERAEKKHRERQKTEVQIRERQIQYRKREYDPLDALEAIGIKFRGIKDKVATPATERQIELLKSLKIPDAEHLSKTRASTILDHAMARRKRKPDEPASATIGQLPYLIANGVEPVEARQMSRNEASAFLSTIFKKGRN